MLLPGFFSFFSSFHQSLIINSSNFYRAEASRTCFQGTAGRITTLNKSVNATVCSVSDCVNRTSPVVSSPVVSSPITRHNQDYVEPNHNCYKTPLCMFCHM